MRHRPFDPSRRALSQMMLAWPLAALAGADEKKELSPRAGCLAATEPGLSAEERARLEKNIAEGEKALAVIRGLKLPPEVAPSLRFQAMKSKRR
jgi:hypothetical protein